jgi:hypothetical protein
MGRPKGNGPLGMYVLKEDSPKMDHQGVELGGIDRIDLAQDWDRWVDV